MKSRLSIRVAAPCETVLPIAAQVERWPEPLPHYRYVRPMPALDGEEHGGERRFAMGARSGPVPVRWEAVQRVLAAERRIEFRHTAGVTRGMLATWRIEPTDGGCTASIEHELTLGWPFVGRLAERRIIGPLFIEPIAGRTLRRVKALAEAAQ